MKFFYKSDIQFVIDSGYMPQSFLTAIEAESRTPDGEKLYMLDANYIRAYDLITGYIESRWDNYWDTLPIVRENIDIVYPFYNDSRRGYDELKYSLRSIEVNFKATTINVWVVGDLPSFISREVNYIQKDRFMGPTNIGDEYHQRKKSIDSSQKMLAAMNDPGMGDNVLIMNDDQYFVNPTPVEVFRHPGAFRPWTAAQLNAWEEGNNWEETRKKSMLHFLSRSPKTVAYDYSTHLPYLYDKTNFLAMASKFFIDQNHVLPNNVGVYCPEVLYYNEYPFDVTPPPAFERIFIHDQMIDPSIITRQINKAFVLNTPKLEYNAVLYRLEGMFPNKSIYER